MRYPLTYAYKKHWLKCIRQESGRMKVRNKNDILMDLIRKLDEKGRHENKPFWQALAKKLNRPRRKAYEVNLFSLEKYAGKETVVVPGYVLGSGSITKPVTVAALRFSGKAQEKIEKAGGKVLDIGDFAESKPNLKAVKIMG